MNLCRITRTFVTSDGLTVGRQAIAKLSSRWLVKPSSVELRLALILVITPTHPPPPGESSFEPLLDYLES